MRRRRLPLSQRRLRPNPHHPKSPQISLPLPLNDFAKAYDGPPTDPKAFEEQQRKLQEELQKKAEEARKKLEGQQSQAPGAPAPAPAPAQKK